MRLRNGKHIDKRIPDSWGSKAYVMWVENCFDPCTYLVRGDSFQDAYDWFICDDHVLNHIRITDEEMGDYDIDNLTYNDSGIPVDTESVMGVTLTNFLR